MDEELARPSDPRPSYRVKVSSEHVVLSLQKHGQSLLILVPVQLRMIRTHFPGSGLDKTHFILTSFPPLLSSVFPPESQRAYRVGIQGSFSRFCPPSCCPSKGWSDSPPSPPAFYAFMLFLHLLWPFPVSKPFCLLLPVSISLLLPSL